jgi:hypothetical protein
MKSEVYKRKVDTPYELLSRNLDAAARIQKCQEKLRLTTRDLRTRVEEYTEVEVVFPNIYCELQQLKQIFHINLKLKWKQSNLLPLTMVSYP